MKTELFAINAGGKRIAQLILAEGADYRDAELFVGRGKVPGAIDVITAEAVPSLAESGARIDAAAREAAGLPPVVQKREESKQFAPGSIEESEARIAGALGNGPATAPTSRLPVVTVPRQEGDPRFSKPTRVVESRVKVTPPAPRPGPPESIELREAIKHIKLGNVIVDGRSYGVKDGRII